MPKLANQNKTSSSPSKGKKGGYACQGWKSPGGIAPDRDQVFSGNGGG